MDSYRYSIIIPHKNTFDLLRRCVASIPVRSDIQIIIVDDNSGINTKKWDTFRKDFPQAELHLTYQGKGAGYARNVGLSHAHGNKVVFADADDFFYENAFEELDKFVDSDLDVVFFLCDSRDGKTMELIPDRMHILRPYIQERNYMGLRFNSMVPWGKLIKRSIIEDNDVRFDEVEVSNDVMFTIRLGLHATKIDVIGTPLYCCTANQSSLYFYKTVERIKTRIKIYKNANDFLHDHHLDAYRIPFGRGIFWHLKFFYPDHPFLLIWGLWKARYKGHTWEYFKDLVKQYREIR